MFTLIYRPKLQQKVVRGNTIKLFLPYKFLEKTYTFSRSLIILIV